MLTDDDTVCEYIVAGKLSISPTCKQLGIPRDEKQPITAGDVRETFAKYTCSMEKSLPGSHSKRKLDPFSPYCMIPLPAPFGSSVLDPACLRRRNERERDRVKCVNDGYLRLKEHLPIENKDKRISKVETLRSAIKYIKYLRRLLGEEVGDSSKHDVNDLNAKPAMKCLPKDVNPCNTDNFKSSGNRVEHSDSESELDVYYFSSDSGEDLENIK